MAFTSWLVEAYICPEDFWTSRTTIRLPIWNIGCKLVIDSLMSSRTMCETRIWSRNWKYFGCVAQDGLRSPLILLIARYDEKGTRGTGRVEEYTNDGASNQRIEAVYNDEPWPLFRILGACIVTNSSGRNRMRVSIWVFKDKLSSCWDGNWRTGITAGKLLSSRFVPDYVKSSEVLVRCYCQVCCQVCCQVKHATIVLSTPRIICSNSGSS